MPRVSDRESMDSNESIAMWDRDGTAARVVGAGHRAITGRGDLAWIGSHAARSSDPRSGATAAVAAIEAALVSEGLELSDLVRIGAYHPATGDPARVREAIREALPEDCRPVLQVLGVRDPALPGAAVVIDATAARGQRSTVGDGAFPAAVRVGDRIWVAGVTGTGGGILDQTRGAIATLQSLADAAGCALDDCVKMNISYIGDGSEADWEPTAKLRGAMFREPAAAATGVPFPRLADGALTQLETLSVAGSAGRRRHGWPDGHWDWPIHLPWKHACRAGDLVTIGGQVSLRGQGEVVDPGDLARQTATALANIDRALATVDGRMSDVVQVTAFFEGTASDLETVLAQTRTAFGADPPPIVPISLPYLAYREMVVEIEVIALVAGDDARG